MEAWYDIVDQISLLLTTSLMPQNLTQVKISQ